MTNCRVIVPRRTSGETRSEYILLSHPEDAQVALLCMPREESLSTLRKLILAAGNYELLMEEAAKIPDTLPPKRMKIETPMSTERDIVQEAFEHALCEYCV